MSRSKTRPIELDYRYLGETKPGRDLVDLLKVSSLSTKEIHRITHFIDMISSYFKKISLIEDNKLKHISVRLYREHYISLIQNMPYIDQIKHYLRYFVKYFYNKNIKNKLTIIMYF